MCYTGNTKGNHTVLRTLPPYLQLAPSRVSDDPHFANTGMDFAGPLYLKIDLEDGKERELEKALFNHELYLTTVDSSGFTIK